MSEAYYRKWRPLDWDHVVGQEHVTTTIKNALENDRIAHAYLFSGPRGTGKTTTARILAKAVNCLSEDSGDKPCNHCDFCNAINAGHFLDLIEIDAASNTSVDDVRSLREKINFSPSQGKYKVYIIDEVHMLSNAAFNALLKTLEEPPDHAIFILATTEVHKIPATVLSRCQRHEFRRIPINSIQANLMQITENENIDIEPTALTEIARQATGSMRDAISLLDQLASTGSKVTLDYAKEVLGTASNENVIEIAKALVNDEAGKAINVINLALDNGSDPRQLGRQIVDYLRTILLVKMGNEEKVDLPQEIMAITADLAGKFDLHSLVQAVDSFDRSSNATSLGWQPGLKLELAVLQICSGEAEKQPASLADQKTTETKKQMENKPVQEKKSTKSEKKQRFEQKTHKRVEPEKVEQVKDAELPKSKEKIDLDKEGIQTYWDAIRKAAKGISPETAALLNSCKSVTLKNGQLILFYTGTILPSKMENGSNKANTRQAVRQVTGNDLDILCKVATNTSEQNTLDDNVDKDGMLGAALSLGGKMTKEK